MADSSLKKENLPKRLITQPVKSPATIAMNMPPAPSALCPKPGAPSATTWGVMMIRNSETLVRPAMSRCLRSRFFSITLNGIRKEMKSEIRPIVHP